MSSPSPTHTTKPSNLSPVLPKQDPMLALNSLSKNPMAQQELATDLSITHRKTPTQSKPKPSLSPSRNLSNQPHQQGPSQIVQQPNSSLIVQQPSSLIVQQPSSSMILQQPSTSL